VTAKRVGKQDNFLIKGTNAVPFDPNAGWKEGDMLPRYVLTSEVSAPRATTRPSANGRRACGPSC